MFKIRLLIIILFFFMSYGSTVFAQPDIDLKSYERIGLISFSTQNVEEKLDEIAKEQFLQKITKIRKEVEVVEIGTLDEVLNQVSKTSLTQEAIRAIGEHFGVKSLFCGEINVSNVKHSSKRVQGITEYMSSTEYMSRGMLRVTFSISIKATLFSTETGDTLWADSVSKEKTASHLSVGKQKISSFDKKIQSKAYRELTEQLVNELTKGFQSK